MTAGILVLAAGRSVRFGADKRLAILPDGQCVIEATLANVRASDLPFLLCLGEGDEELVNRLEARDIPCQRCRRAGEGIGATLAEGVGHIPGWSGVLVALADMPWVGSTTYRAVANRLSASNIVVPVHDGRRGHPVGFGRAFYPELAALGGDAGARALLDVHAARVTAVKVADAAIHRDIDVPADLSL
ncbi:MAG TPA: nucleotidyltransferase family protein [Halioglobus sp.]